MNAPDRRIECRCDLIQVTPPAASPIGAYWRRIALVLAELRVVGAQALTEIRRLNRAGVAPEVLNGRPRGERARLIKSALSQRHGSGPTRCC